MKIEYIPSEVKTYNTVESFKVTCKLSEVGMWVWGDSVRFVGWNSSTAQWDPYGFKPDKLTPELLVKFVEAYKNRGK